MAQRSSKRQRSSTAAPAAAELPLLQSRSTPAAVMATHSYALLCNIPDAARIVTIVLLLAELLNSTSALRSLSGKLHNGTRQFQLRLLRMRSQTQSLTAELQELTAEAPTDSGRRIGADRGAAAVYVQSLRTSSLLSCDSK